MEFENDVFLSYAHIDDQALSEGQKGWISTFHRALEVRLGQLLGKPPRIFRDPKLQGNDFFADRLVDRLPRVATLISILSPRYVKSDWCTRELREFMKASEGSGGARVADKSRVFKVVKTPIPLEQHPAELQEVLGYEFFTVEPDTGRPRELSHLADPDLQRKYWARLDDLAHDISELLEMMERRDAPGGPAVPAMPAMLGVMPPSERGTVYLAETSFDLRDRRDAVRRELQGRGWEVLPDRPLPLVAVECEAVVREALDRSTLSIHLVGRNYGIVPEGSASSIVALQNELAALRGAAGGLSRLLWMPPDLEPEDDRQRRFVESLETDAKSGVDLLVTPFDEFATALARRLEPPPAEAGAAGVAREERGVAGGGEGPARIYLICDQRDLEATIPLGDHLFDLGFEVITPVFEGDEAQVRREHEESLTDCDAALVYYGAAGELWLRQKLRELLKCAAGRERPLLVRAIYVAPPETTDKRRLRTHEALVLRQEGESFSPAALAPFVLPLQPQGARA